MFVALEGFQRQVRLVRGEEMSSADGVWPPDSPVKEMMMETLEDSIPGPGNSPGVV